jgi:flagellar biosynthesis/type III secretory pathway protein FliH
MSIMLELEVPVYNINEGHNQAILGKSATLNGYSVFVEKSREYKAETCDAGEAVKRTLVWCINHGFLTEYLKANGSEVINMLLTEWNTEDAIRVRSQEAWEDGIKLGEERGIKLGEQRSAATIAQYQAQNAQYQAEIAALKRQLERREYQK